MRYFFLAFALIVLLVISFFGFRGDTFSGTPLRLFPDMDDQDKIKTQRPVDFSLTAWDHVSQLPAPFLEALSRSGVVKGFGHDHSFGNSISYLDTGKMGDAYGDGMPSELRLTDKNRAGFLRHGKERYIISCMPCHGEAADGKGIVAVIGIPAVPSLMNFPKPNYPDGKMFETITKGKGLMSGYGYNIPVNDRWAIIAYVRALQAASKTASK